MTERKIIIEPDPILRKKSDDLKQVDNDLRKLLDDMRNEISLLMELDNPNIVKLFETYEDDHEIWMILE